MSVANDKLSEQRARPRRRRLRTFLLCTLGTLALIILPALAYRQYFVWQAERRLAELEAELDRTDPGWRFEEILAARKQIPDEENSAPLVLEVAKLLPPGWPAKPAVPQPLWQPKEAGFESEEELAALVQVYRLEPNTELRPRLASMVELEANQLAVAIAKSHALSAAPPEGRYALTWDRSFATSRFRHLESMRAVTSLIELDGVNNLHQDKQGMTLQPTIRMIVVARSAGDESHSIAFLTRSTIDHCAIRYAERTLGHGVIGEGELRHAQRELAEERNLAQKLLAESIRADRAGYAQLLQRIAEGEFSYEALVDEHGDHPPNWLEHMGRWCFLYPCIRHSQCTYLEAMQAPVDISRLEPELQFDANETWSTEFKRKWKAEPYWTKYAHVPVPALGRIITNELRLCALLDCSIVALACERYRLVHGEWPDIIDDLIPQFLHKVPRDCFRKAPLNLRPLPDGVVIYSVAPDGEDDGGRIVRGDRPAPIHYGPFREDIGFRLWDVEKRRLPSAPPKSAEELTP